MPLAPRPESADVDVLVVGAGLAGSVMAERFATERGARVLVLDRRPHIAGNAFDHVDDAGVLCHRYGPHIFHTNADKVVQYLSRFTAWRPYEHRVLAAVDGRTVPVPINRTTLNTLYGAGLRTDDDAAAFLSARAEHVAELRTSEDAVVAKVGRDLYERLFRGYTRKQWSLDPAQLHASVCARIPVRTNDDDRYFTDGFQQMPADGYTAMVGRMLEHERIEVRTGTAFEDVQDELSWGHLVWTGPIDDFFGHRLGHLPYRSLRFEHEVRQTPGGGLVQPVAQVNHPDERVPYTRVTEFRHLTGQVHDRSTLAYEYPADEGEPYYPVPRDENRERYGRYQVLARRTPGVTFVGRLARYQYLNMDQVIAGSLAEFERLVARGAAPAVAA